MKITNSKSQITNKFQIPNHKLQTKKAFASGKRYIAQASDPRQKIIRSALRYPETSVKSV
jgi:hypothetical protein